MKHSFYFYTTFSLLIILGLIISGYIFGWTVPSANPPSGNLSAPINTGSTNQAKTGYLAVGTSTTPTYPLEVGNQLRVWGQLISKVASGTAPFVVDSSTKVTNLNTDLLDGYDSADLMAGEIEIPAEATTYFYNGGNPYYCRKKTINTSGFVNFFNINDTYICDTNKICSNGECVTSSGGTYCDDDNDGHISSYLVTNCTNVKYYGGDDCDDACATCYPGSLSFTTSPDGHDQDCDGQVDETSSIILVYMSTTSYSGNLGGRSGADSKCDLGTTLACESGKNRALLSVSSSDEIIDMPTNYGYSTTVPIYWYNRSNGQITPLANNWSDMCDGNILTAQNAGTGTSFNAWTGSDSNCNIASYTCTNWTSTDSGGQVGSGSSNGAGWVSYSTAPCYSSTVFLRCVCQPAMIYF